MKINQEFLKILRCPERLCRGGLSEVFKNDKNYLLCDSCSKEYPVEEGIPILFPNVKYSHNYAKRHWDEEDRAGRYAQKYDSYLKKEGTAWGLYTHDSEIAAIKKLTEDIDLTGKTIIDGGCGNGRLLSLYPEAKIKIGVDTSIALLKAAKKREPEFWFVCCQLEDMPFMDCVADFSVSIRVYQHLKYPEDAFSEMVRTTKPSGYVCLEVYNKLNLKEIYKKFRMSKFVSKNWNWGMDYDRYFSYREIEKWCEINFVKPISYCGAGWGFYFYFLEFLKFRSIAPEFLQKIIYDFFFAIEKKINSMIFLNKTMEKICFIGSIQGQERESGYFGQFKEKLGNYTKKKKIKKFEIIFKDRNYCYTGSDLHHLVLSVNWLTRAQDATCDGGVSRGFSLLKNRKSNSSGWQPSYPETTGYIIPSLIDAANILGQEDLKKRAKRMADWEIAILYPDGAAHGGNISSKNIKAVFDTGQVIRGFLAAYKAFGKKEYLNSAEKSAGWILKNEHEKKGVWLKNNAECVSSENTTYNIYAIAPVADIGMETGNYEFISLGKRVAEHTIRMQNENGWFRNNDFKSQKDALLHTIAYTIDGLWDLGEKLKSDAYLNSAKKSLDQVLKRMKEDGFLPGRFDDNFEGTVKWSCLTGMAQTGVICMKVFKSTNDRRYYDSAFKIKEFLKTCQNNFDDEYGYKGALWGSWPISGEYGRYQSFNWAVKYLLDLLLTFESNQIIFDK